MQGHAGPMNDHASAGLLWARLLAAVGIVGVVLGTATMAFTRDGLTSATGWFQLTQGVAGVALGWLFTSQGMDAALLRAAEEARQAEKAKLEGVDLTERLARIEAESAITGRVLAALYEDPSVRAKVDAVVREVGDR